MADVSRKWIFKKHADVNMVTFSVRCLFSMLVRSLQCQRFVTFKGKAVTKFTSSERVLLTSKAKKERPVRECFYRCSNLSYDRN